MQAAEGGALIGAAAGGLLLVTGRIAGVSGILANAASAQPGFWRWAFLAGLVAAAFVAPLAGIASPATVHQTGWFGLVVAGLLVGSGARLGSGCTSGHGVCGLSNLSPRSLTATIIFMSVAAITVFVVRHVWS